MKTWRNNIADHPQHNRNSVIGLLMFIHPPYNRGLVSFLYPKWHFHLSENKRHKISNFPQLLKLEINRLSQLCAIRNTSLNEEDERVNYEKKLYIRTAE